MLGAFKINYRIFAGAVGGKFLKRLSLDLACGGGRRWFLCVIVFIKPQYQRANVIASAFAHKNTTMACVRFAMASFHRFGQARVPV